MPINKLYDEFGQQGKSFVLPSFRVRLEGTLLLRRKIGWESSRSYWELNYNSKLDKAKREKCLFHQLKNLSRVGPILESYHSFYYKPKSKPYNIHI